MAWGIVCNYLRNVSATNFFFSPSCLPSLSFLDPYLVMVDLVKELGHEFCDI